MMNKLVRILMSKSIKRVLNPKDKYGMVFSGEILRRINKNVKKQIYKLCNRMININNDTIILK